MIRLNKNKVENKVIKNVKYMENQEKYETEKENDNSTTLDESGRSINVLDEKVVNELFQDDAQVQDNKLSDIEFDTNDELTENEEELEQPEYSNRQVQKNENRDWSEDEDDDSARKHFEKFHQTTNNENLDRTAEENNSENMEQSEKVEAKRNQNENEDNLSEQENQEDQNKNELNFKKQTQLKPH